MKIFCLITFVFLATSFTTNNENFENISKSETLEVKKPTEEYRVTAYTKNYNGGWEKATIKVSITSVYGTEMMTVVAFNSGGTWVNVNQMVNKTFAMTDGEDAASRFEYKSGYYYFNM